MLSLKLTTLFVVFGLGLCTLSDVAPEDREEYEDNYFAACLRETVYSDFCSYWIELMSCLHDIAVVDDVRNLWELMWPMHRKYCIPTDEAQMVARCNFYLDSVYTYLKPEIEHAVDQRRLVNVYDWLVDNCGPAVEDLSDELYEIKKSIIDQYTK